MCIFLLCFILKNCKAQASNHHPAEQESSEQEQRRSRAELQPVINVGIFSLRIESFLKKKRTHT